MSSLYDITGEYLQLMNMMEDLDVDPEVVADSLEAVKGELEVKALGYIHVVKELEMKASAIEKEADFFEQKLIHIQKNIKSLKNALCDAMIATGHDDSAGLTAGNYTLKVQGNGGKQPMVVDGEVPDAFMKVIYEPDKEKIRAALQDGKELDFAHLEPRGKHLAIK